MKKELEQQINAILHKEIDDIFIEVALKIAPKVKDPKYMPWLLAHKMDVQSAKVLLALPDDNHKPEYADFQVSDQFVGKLGMDKGYIEAQLEERYYSGDVMLDKEKGSVLSKNRGFWIDLQHNVKWRERNGNAYYVIVGIMTDEEFTPTFEDAVQDNIDRDRSGFVRIVPRYDSVKDIDGLLPEENYKEILKSREIIAQLPCACRLRHPEYNQDEGVCLTANNAAREVIKRGIGKEISWEEAFEYVQKAGKKQPHVHESTHATRLSEVGDVLCNCHIDTCAILRRGSNVGGKFPTHEMYGKSRYRAVVEPKECIDCGLCYKKRCMFDAIRVRFDKDLGEEKPFVNETMCIGCGCCVETCPSNAIHMKVAAPPEALSGKRSQMSL